MVPFIVYSTIDGTILRGGLCDVGMVLAQSTAPDTAAMEGTGEWATHRVDTNTNTIVELAPAVVHKRLNQPPPYIKPTHWDWTAGAGGDWVDDRTFEEKRAASLRIAKEERNADEYGLFVWDNSAFDCDAASQQRITTAATKALAAIVNQGAFSVDWMLADNTIRTLDAEDMVAVAEAMQTHVNAAHEAWRLVRQQALDATTPEELPPYDPPPQT